MKRILGYWLARLLAPLLCVLIWHAPAMAQISAFDSTTNTLALPLLIKDGVAYSNATLSLPPNDKWSFTVPGNVAGLSSKVGASYSTATGAITIPYVQLDNAYFYDVKLQLPAGQPWRLLSYGDFNQTITQASTLSFPIKTTADNWWATDTGGVMSYMLDNGQVWRIVADDPCFPPLTVPTGAPPPGKADIWIAPNPDNGVANYLMITSFDNGVNTAEESCIVTPVLMPGLEVTATGQPFDVSQATLSGAVNKSYDLYISGGTKPYMLKMDNPAIASVQLLPQATQDIGGQTVRVTLLKSGTAALTVYDFNRLKKQVALTAQSDLVVFPSEISVPAGTVPLQVYISGGVPPYRTLNPSQQKWVANTDPSAISTTESAMTLTFLADTGGNKMPIYILDSVGGMTAVQVTITAASTTSGTSATGTAITTAAGGKPPLK